jgi:hypothetical protein
LRAAFNHAKKVAAKMHAQVQADKRFAMMQGVSGGLDEQIFLAVTGPRAKHYDGHQGELAMECQRWLADEWKAFFAKHRSTMTTEQVKCWSSAAARKGKAEPYGYPAILALVGDDVADGITNEQHRALFLASVDSVDQYERDARRGYSRFTMPSLTTRISPSVSLSSSAAVLSSGSTDAAPERAGAPAPAVSAAALHAAADADESYAAADLSPAVPPSPAAVKAPSPAAVKAPSPAAVKAPSPAAVKAPSPAASPAAVKAPSPAAVKAPSPAAVKAPSPAAAKRKRPDDPNDPVANKTSQAFLAFFQRPAQQQQNVENVKNSKTLA